jgi:3-oxoacyl-[acyl-carrier protein] reductase
VDLGIAGRVALVTAASRGLGRASALALAEAGARVAICARGEAGLGEAERELSAHTDVLAMAADVTVPGVPESLVSRTVERFGTLEILVANAGGPPAGPALAQDDEAIADALNGNLLTSVRLVRAAVPHMRARRWGRVCLITSSTIKQPSPTLALSNTARTGLWAWAKTVAGEVFDDGITVNTACPGTHATDRMQQLGIAADVRVGDPRRFGQVVAFLCSEPAAFVNGVALLVDGGRFAGLS